MSRPSKKTKSKQQDFIPEVLTAIEYESVYGNDGKAESIADCLHDIPTAVVLNYVLNEHWPIHFAMNAPHLHTKVVFKLRDAIPKKYRKNIIARKNGTQKILIDSQATLHVCYEALRNFVPMSMYEDNDINPAQDELENIYRAYLKANSYWTSKQTLSSDIVDISLGIEVPFIEFKHHKKFLTAVYKSFKFFEFCENTPPFDDYLSHMLADIGLSDWHQYVDLFVIFYSKVINTPYVMFDETNQDAYAFFKQFSVNISDLKALGEWEGNKSIKYLRDHFILDFDNNMLLVLSPDFICDKLYQGLKFMMWNSIQNHKLNHPNGKKLKDFQTFLGLLGDCFSEKYLIDEIIHKSLDGNVDSIYADIDINKAGISSPSDFYIKKGDTLILIEYKDAIFPDDSKHSGDLDKIKRTIQERICLDEEKESKPESRKLKGVGQLLDTISRIAKGEYNVFDPSYADIKIILPVVVTTDITFSALGVNAYVVQQTNDMIKRHNDTLKGSGIFTAIPTIIDIDSLIDISYMLHKKEVDLFGLISKYMQDNRMNIQSFSVFISDFIIKGKQVSKDELRFLIPSLKS